MTHDVVTIFNEIRNSNGLYVLYGFLDMLHRCVYVQANFYVYMRSYQESGANFNTFGLAQIRFACVE